VGVRDGPPAFTVEQVRAALKGIQETNAKATQEVKAFSAAVNDAAQENRATEEELRARIAEIRKGR